LLNNNLGFYFLLFLSNVLFAQGPYDPAAGQEGSKAIHKDFYAIERWANTCEVARGKQDISKTGSLLADYGEDNAAIGYSDGSAVSLGDSGYAILTFNPPITNTLGPDFAIFENSFSDFFLELAFVEVSSDGVNYVRFPSVSLTQTTTQIGAFGELDPTNIYNLAGKYRAFYGTPFDLEELKDSIGIDINAITHIKIIDVVGSINDAYATFDTQGNKVNDPWPTEFSSSGFDLDAVAVLGTITSIDEEQFTHKIKVFMNSDVLYVNYVSQKNEAKMQIMDVVGKQIYMGHFEHELSLSHLPSGFYFLQIVDDNQIYTSSFYRR
jgi:hypothetical protein